MQNTFLAKHEHFNLYEILGFFFLDKKCMVMVMAMNLYHAFSMYIYSNALYKHVIYEQRPEHNTGNYVPYSLR